MRQYRTTKKMKWGAKGPDDCGSTVGDEGAMGDFVEVLKTDHVYFEEAKGGERVDG